MEQMNRAKKVVKRVVTRKSALEKRVAILEREIQEVRQVNFRLAELSDVVAELLVPISERDQERVDELLAAYRSDVNTI